MSTSSETITAIATPYGRASIGVIRLSGPNALKITQQIWLGGKLKPHRLTLGWVIDKQVRIDQAMTVYMPAPRSYTGEEITEIQLHGSPIILNRVLDLIISKGARLAEPGEFTKRAYLNGKLDFTQAEAVGDIITGEHEALLKLSTDQLAGSIVRKTAQIKTDLARLCARIVAQLDFSEDDIADLAPEEIIEDVDNIAKALKSFIRGSDTVVKLREGIKIALVGLPNAGKSTLLNKMLGWDRAIVTEIAGTTRDIIEENISIDGYNFRLVDTAGLNFEPEMIEQLGIERTIRELGGAQLILLLIEPGKHQATLDYLAKNNLETILNRDNTLVVMTKSDLGKSERIKQFDSVSISQDWPTSIKRLGKKIVNKSIGKATLESANLATKRQLDCVQKAQLAINRAKRSVANQEPYDIILVDLEDCLMNLNELTGEQVTDRVIDELFANFCIGK